MFGFRHRIIHEYFGVDLEIIWKIIVAYLDELESKVRELKEK